jgi:putative hemolysin
MLTILRGRYVARTTADPADVARAQALRWRAFRGRAGTGGEEGRDADAFDAVCTHVLVEEVPGGRLVACFRLMPVGGGERLGESYASQFYGLSGLAGYPGRMVEMGRFCMDPACHDPDVLRVAWGAMTRFVDENGVDLIFGCASFTGTDPEAYLDAFAMLRERHIAPRRWLPRVKAPRVFRFAQALRRFRPDPRRALAAMPPLLRSYLLMGGWVSDHAVVDPDLGTLHVFTGLEIRNVPPSRAALLRGVAG